MHIFGWCNDGFHAGKKYEYGTPCPGTYRRRHVDKRKRGRKVVETVLLDEEVACECPCHAPVDVVDSEDKPKRKRRSKK